MKTINQLKLIIYFDWSTESIYEDQPVFVVGNPGSTNRLYTMAQLEFLRDYRFGPQIPMRKELYAVYEELVKRDKR